MFALSSVSFIGGENRSTRGRDRIVVGFVGILDTTLCDKFCQFVCPFVFCPLCCLFFFDLQILITSLVFSNSSFP
jgi:hypothetical protein